jgi:tight adherence protein C
MALMRPAETEIQERLRVYGYRPNDRDLTASFGDRVLLPLITRLASLARIVSPGSFEEDLRRRLAQAGYFSGQSVSSFLAAKAAGMVLLPLVFGGLLLLRGQLELRTAIFAVVLGVLGWRLPNLWLGRRIDGRQLAIERALPDALDLIVVCVEAGNALEAALANVTRRMHGPLPEELDRTLREIALGKTRREALRDLGQRTGVADLQTFLAAILQADQLGVSIAQVLRVQAEAMRVRRRQRAEEQAAKLTVKMLFPLILLIFPAIFIISVGPAALRMIEFFSTNTIPGQ